MFVKHIILWILAIMMFLTFIDVLLRYFFSSPVPGATELIEFMMGIVVTFSVAYTAHERSHIAVDLVIEHFSDKVRKVLSCITSFLTLVLFIFICYQTFILISEDYHSHIISAVLYIPVYPFITIVSIGFLILCLVLLAEFLGYLGGVLSLWTRS